MTETDKQSWWESTRYCNNQRVDNNAGRLTGFTTRETFDFLKNWLYKDLNFTSSFWVGIMYSKAKGALLSDNGKEVKATQTLEAIINVTELTSNCTNYCLALTKERDVLQPLRCDLNLSAICESEYFI